MDVTITERRENPMFDRTEVYFSVDHPNAPTPTRADLRKAVGDTVNAKGAVVVLAWARSEFGRNTTRGYAKVYASKEQALALETRPILLRNGLIAAEAKPAAGEVEAEAPAPPPKKREAKKPAKEAKEPAEPAAPEPEAPKEEPPKEARPKAAKKADAPKKSKAEKKEAKPPKEKAETEGE